MRDDLMPMSLLARSDIEVIVELTSLGSLLFGEIATGRCQARRGAQDIARRPLDALFILEQAGPVASRFATIGAPAIDLGNGDLIFCDADQPFTWSLPAGHRHRFYVLPRVALGRRIALRAAAHFVPCVAPVGRLLASYLAALRMQGSALTATERLETITIAARLMELAMVPGPGEAAEPACLARIKQAIAQKLTDPMLCPKRIAKQCGMSVRKLHALFEPTGASFSAYVTRQRLALARRQLRETGRDTPAVSDIAFHLGFNSLSTFYRTYRAEYGQSPGETRAIACTQQDRACTHWEDACVQNVY